MLGGLPSVLVGRLRVTRATAVPAATRKDPDGPKLVFVVDQWRGFTDSLKAGDHRL
jgi:hypothetical protein